MTDIDRQALRDFMATEVMQFTTHPKLPYSWIKDGNPVCDMDQWTPDLDSNQLDMLIDKMVEDGLEIEIYLSPGDPAEVEICDPKLRNVRCYETGDDRIALERHPDRRLAVLLAIKAAKEAK